MAHPPHDLESGYPVCRKLLGEALPDVALPTPENLPSFVEKYAGCLTRHPYLPELVRIEAAVYRLTHGAPEIPLQPAAICINPALVVLQVSWRGLLKRLEDSSITPEPADEFVLIWKNPRTGRIEKAVANGHDLLALKIVAEDMAVPAAAAAGGVTIGVIDGILRQASAKGLLLSPASQIRRPPGFQTRRVDSPALMAAEVFTLQWHITHQCDLHCRHCYDRSDRSPLALAQAVAVLDDFYNFCKTRHIRGQISFTGGNPLLYPYFDEIYRGAVERGFMTAILGNPASRGRMKAILSMQPPEFFQVSLEGLASHNDDIRGPGHFRRVLAFLDLLRELGIFSMVMLTLTEKNMGQVLPLAEQLRGRADLFTFSRLSAVGKGAQLKPAAPAGYRYFLADYLAAAAGNPVMALKENLFNILLAEQGRPLFGGCTGFGCGAAFNFISLLPDGEVHACRKFPSLIGRVQDQSIGDIYDGEAACRYRDGSRACRGCEMRPVCGGCMAVTGSMGGRVFEDRDPYCFFGPRV